MQAGGAAEIEGAKQLVQAFMHGIAPLNAKIERNPTQSMNDSGVVAHDRRFEWSRVPK